MRIISGRFRGRQLVSFQASHIRPTTDRVKESVFNKLMSDIPEARVLDLFAGTGNLGLEALSRGASSVTCVENHRKSLKILRDNLRLLKVEDEVDVVPLDVFRFVKEFQGEPFDVILADPPFTQKIAHSVMEHLAASQTYAPHTVVVVESSSQERIDDEYGAFKLLDRKSFGDKRVSYFSPVNAD